MAKIKIRVNNYESQIFKVLDKQKLLNILKNIDVFDLHEIIEEMFWEAWNNNVNSLYESVYVYLDARDGKLYKSLSFHNEQLHPYDDFYRIVLSYVTIPIDIPDEELIDYFEDKDIIEEAENRGISIMTVLEEKGILNDRITNVFDSWAWEEVEKIQHDKFRRKQILEQIENLYLHEIKE